MVKTFLLTSSNILALCYSDIVISVKAFMSSLSLKFCNIQTRAMKASTHQINSCCNWPI